ncbi:hypothetical protein Tco_0530465, partial [Tanacetum coccineum]
MNHKVVGVIHEERKKARINLKTGLKGRVNILLIKGVIGDETERRNKNKSKASGRRKRDGKRRSRINSGHEDLYGDEEHYFRATKLDFPE